MLARVKPSSDGSNSPITFGLASGCSSYLSNRRGEAGFSRQ
jgi:hypothetical protein